MIQTNLVSSFNLYEQALCSNVGKIGGQRLDKTKTPIKLAHGVAMLAANSLTFLPQVCGLLAGGVFSLVAGCLAGLGSKGNKGQAFKLAAKKWGAAGVEVGMLSMSVVTLPMVAIGFAITLVATKATTKGSLDKKSMKRSFARSNIAVSALLRSLGGAKKRKETEKQPDNEVSKEKQPDNNPATEVNRDGAPDRDIAKDKKSQKAQFLLRERVKKDIEAAGFSCESVQKAAEQREPHAQYLVGMMYQAGLEVGQSDEKAVEYLRKAADGGHVHAQNVLGCMYLRGLVKEPDPQTFDSKAFKWFKLAAWQGSLDARFNLGLMYHQGIGVEQSDKEAARWYENAANYGLWHAQNNLGWMYEKGEGVPQSDEKAFECYQAAIKQDPMHAYPYHNLARLYAEGRGVVKSEEEAKKYRATAQALDFFKTDYHEFEFPHHSGRTIQLLYGDTSS